MDTIPHLVQAKTKQAAPGALTIETVVEGGVNDKCHSWHGHLDPHGKLILGYPEIIAVYWDDFFSNNANALTLMTQFFTQIMISQWIDGLAQYGVQHGTFASAVTVTDSAPTKLSRDQLEAQLIHWLDNGAISLKPADRELRRLYILFTPHQTELTLDGLSSKKDFAGYHWWSRYNIPPIFTTENLFWAAIPMPTVSSSPNVNAVVDSLTPIVCHEMAEAFTDRNGDGYQNGDGCEIGDICETKTVVRIGNWWVQRYWSDAHQRCIPLHKAAFIPGNLLWVGRFKNPSSDSLLTYFPADDNWSLAIYVSGTFSWSLASNTSRFGHGINDGRPFWIGDFNGDGHADVLFYYPGDDNWWLGVHDGSQLQWSLAGNTSRFGHGINDGRPFWIGDFNGDGRADVLFYYPGDDNWWLGVHDGSQLQWSLAGNTSRFGHGINDGRPFWIGDFNGDGHADVLFYYPGDDNWWLGVHDGSQLQWSLAGNTSRFGHGINDGRPFWIGDFNGDGRADVLFYYPGDDNWWLGVHDGSQLQWSLAGNTSRFGHGINDGRPFWIGDFNGDGRADVLFYYPGDDNWWLGVHDGSQLQWSLAGNTSRFGHGINDGRPFWIGDFNGDGRADVLFYYPGDDNWWLGKFDGNSLNWSLAGNSDH